MVSLITRIMSVMQKFLYTKDWIANDKFVYFGGNWHFDLERDVWTASEDEPPLVSPKCPLVHKKYLNLNRKLQGNLMLKEDEPFHSVCTAILITRCQKKWLISIVIVQVIHRLWQKNNVFSLSSCTTIRPKVPVAHNKRKSQEKLVGRLPWNVLHTVMLSRGWTPPTRL